MVTELHRTQCIPTAVNHKSPCLKAGIRKSLQTGTVELSRPPRRRITTVAPAVVSCCNQIDQMSVATTVMRQSSVGHFWTVSSYRAVYMLCLSFKRPSDCAFNSTMRRVPATTVAVDKQYWFHIFGVCSLSYPARKAHAPYYAIICDQSGFTTFFHIIS